MVLEFVQVHGNKLIDEHQYAVNSTCGNNNIDGHQHPEYGIDDKFLALPTKQWRMQWM